MLKALCHCGASGFAFLVLLGVASFQVRAHEVPSSGKETINGVYELKEVTAAGVYSAGEEQEAREFVGYFLTVHGEHVVLPNSVLCHIASSERLVLKDGRESFGTAGGSWSEVGLQRNADNGYEVTEITFDCDGPFRGLIVQPESHTYLLPYWSVYLVLGRE